MPRRFPVRGHVLVAGAVGVLGLVLVVSGCAGVVEGGGPAASDEAAASDPPSPTAPATPSFDQALHDELIAMLARDQLDRTGGSSGESDQTRTDRLEEIIDEYGRPTITSSAKTARMPRGRSRSTRTSTPHSSDARSNCSARPSPPGRRRPATSPTSRTGSPSRAANRSDTAPRSVAVRTGPSPRRPSRTRRGSRHDDRPRGSIRTPTTSRR